MFFTDDETEQQSFSMAIDASRKVEYITHFLAKQKSFGDCADDIGLVKAHTMQYMWPCALISDFFEPAERGEVAHADRPGGCAAGARKRKPKKDHTDDADTTAAGEEADDNTGSRAVVVAAGTAPAGARGRKAKRPDFHAMNRIFIFLHGNTPKLPKTADQFLYGAAVWQFRPVFLKIFDDHASQVRTVGVWLLDVHRSFKFQLADILDRLRLTGFIANDRTHFRSCFERGGQRIKNWARNRE